MSDLSGTCIGEDPIGIALKECLKLIIAIRRENSLIKQKNSAATLILGGSNEYFGSSDFNNSNPLNKFLLDDDENGSLILKEILALKRKLSQARSIYSIDAMFLLSPFLKVLKEKAEVESIRKLVLESIRKFFTFQLINSNCINYLQAYRSTVFTLIELNNDFSNNQNINDLMEIEIITLLQHIISTSCGDCLSDSLVYESLKKVLLIVCRRKLSDKLRVRAEYVLTKMTIRVFSKLKFIDLTAINDKYIDDEQIKKYFVFKKANNSSEFDLQEEIISNTDTNAQTYVSNDEDETPHYGLPVIIQYLELLVSLISLENKSDYTMKTQILGLELINIMIELVGRLFLKHPKLLNMISDSVFKSIALIIETNRDNIELMDKVLKVYTSIIISLGWFLPRQIELTLPRLFNKLTNPSSSPQFKTIIIERLSLLWMREPSLFINLFVKFDCSFEFKDMSNKFLTVMIDIIDPSNNLNVSIFALNALITFVNNIHDQINKVNEVQFDGAGSNKILQEWSRKAEFIQCVDKFNDKPREGIEMLMNKKFIQDDSIKSVAKFLFENSARLNKKQLGLLLCHPDESVLLLSFMNNINFNNLRIDEALRIMLTKFRLPGESQQIERIVECFAKRYVETQRYNEPVYCDDEEHDSQVQPDSDSIFVLSYSIIMLNTDLHNPQVKEHMSFEEYSSNLRGCYNAGQDYPMWYLKKIYSSIEDKEIVMPEEHHGSEEWFDDVWNNLISSNSVITEIPRVHLDDINRFTNLESAQFEMKLFEKICPVMINKLFELLNLTSDDNTINLLIDCIEQCYKICKFFKLKSSFNLILFKLSEMTTLLPVKEIHSTSESSESLVGGEQERSTVIDIIDVDGEDGEDNKEIITVSSHSIKLGSSFKSQMCFILYFNILGHNKIMNFISGTNWSNLIEIIMTMFNERMIINNVNGSKFFPDFDDLSLNSEKNVIFLPPPDYTINDINFKTHRGLFSSFASYLKGDDEPTEQDIIESSRCKDCIKMINFKEYIWQNNSVITVDNLINLFEEHIPLERDVVNFKSFEYQIIFIIELSIKLMIGYDLVGEVGYKLYNKVVQMFQMEGLSKGYYRRAMVYKILILVELKEFGLLCDIVSDEVMKSNEIFTMTFFNETLDGQYIVKIILNHLNRDDPLLWEFLSYLMCPGGVESSKVCVEYISDSSHLSGNNVSKFITLVDKMVNNGVSMIDTLLKIVSGDMRLEFLVESQDMILIIQLIIKELLNRGGEEEEESMIVRVGQSLRSADCLLRKYDVDTLRHILEHSMLTVFGGSDDSPRSDKLVQLSRDIMLEYFGRGE